MTTQTDLLPPPAPLDVSDLSTPDNAPQEPQPPAPLPHRNALKIMDRVRLIEWMKLPENTDYVAKNSDTDAAAKATIDLNLDPSIPAIGITPANITGIRTTLGIAKFKPEKPADPPAPIDLATLQKQFKATKIEANSTREVVNLLVQHLFQLQQILDHNADRLNPLPLRAKQAMEALKPLPVLNPLPTT